VALWEGLVHGQLEPLLGVGSRPPSGRLRWDPLRAERVGLLDHPKSRGRTGTARDRWPARACSTPPALPRAWRCRPPPCRFPPAVVRASNAPVVHCSSEDFGSSVERNGSRHPLCRCSGDREAVAGRRKRREGSGVAEEASAAADRVRACRWWMAVGGDMTVSGSAPHRTVGEVCPRITGVVTMSRSRSALSGVRSGVWCTAAQPAWSYGPAPARPP
jgi:hypothetical protein